MWMLPLYLHINQKSDYDIMIYIYIYFMFLHKSISCWYSVESGMLISENKNCEIQEKIVKYLFLDEIHREICERN